MVDPRDVARLISENPDEVAQSSGAHFYDVNTLRSNRGNPDEVAQGNPDEVAQGNPDEVAQGNPDEVAQGNPDEMAQGVASPNSRGFDLVDVYSNYYEYDDEQDKEELRQKLGKVIDRISIEGAEHLAYGRQLPNIYDMIGWLNDHPQGRVELQADKNPFSSSGDVAYTLYSPNFDDIDYDRDDDPLGGGDGMFVTEKSRDTETKEFYFHLYNQD